jgi:hypothetical protein
MKAYELIGPALDWAVAKCENKTKIYQWRNGERRVIDTDHAEYAKAYLRNHHCYSTDWAQGGPIIEREQIAIDYDHDVWNASKYGGRGYVDGPTPLVAAMRCYVYSRLDDDVDVPEELLP